MGKLTIVSAAFYDNEDPAWRLALSCQQMALPLSIYGIKEFGENWRNMKVLKLLEHLENIDTEYMLYTDSADSWMLANEEQIMSKFKGMQTDILVSGERSMYPFFDCDYPKAPTTLRYICAGGFMGRTKSVKKLLKELLKYGDDGNDQFLWHKLFLDARFDIKIDHLASVFLAMGSVSMDEIKIAIAIEDKPPKLNEEYQFGPPYIEFKETKNWPCVIHFNGGKGGSPNEVNMLQTWDRWQHLVSCFEEEDEEAEKDFEEQE